MDSKKSKKVNSTQSGFTLVELVVVLVILAILASILVPALLSYIDSSRRQEEYTNARMVYTALQSKSLHREVETLRCSGKATK